MRLLITGDAHGSATEYINKAEQISDLNEEDIIIIAGDAGLQYGTYNMGAAKKTMKKYPCSWVIMRGNHDNRYWRDHKDDDKWHLEKKWDNYVMVEDKYPNIFYVRDEGGVYNFGPQKRVLFIPGAFSVDGQYRLNKGLPFEVEEQLNIFEWDYLYDKEWLPESEIGIDYIVSHTYPRSMEDEVSYLFMDFIDQEKIDKSTEDNLEVFYKEALANPEFKHWYFGHMHDTKHWPDKKISMLYRRVVEMGE